MSRRSVIVIGMALFASGALLAPSSSLRRPTASAATYAKLPLSFELNRGQAAPGTDFVAHADRYALGLSHASATLALRDDALQISLARATRDTRPEGLDARPAKVNYFLGNDPSRWIVDVPTYSQVRYAGVYAGVDLVFYGNQEQLEYDLIVKPGADPRQIALRVDGAERREVDAAGDLVLTLAGTHRNLHQKRPTIYQESHGVRRAIAGGYALRDNNEVVFWLGPYDRDVALTIDPIVMYAGGFGSDGNTPTAVAVDAQGATYVTGATFSKDFPTGRDALQRGLKSYQDAFVAKIDASGMNLVYATYLGGNDGRHDVENPVTSETAYAIAVDFAGNAYLTGMTESTDFPTVNAYQSQSQYNISRGKDGFVAKLNPTGSALVYSTYLGGRDGRSSGNGIAVDAIGNAYVAGDGPSQFPTTLVIGPPGTRGPGFVTKFNPAGGLVYSTRLPGGMSKIAVDGAGQAHVVGTAGSDFPMVNGWQATCPASGSSCNDAMLAKLSASGSQILYSTYVGGPLAVDFIHHNVANGVTVDAAGNAYVVGTTSSTQFPTVKPAQRTYGGGEEDAFVASFGPSGNVRYATYLGGGHHDLGSSIAADPAGNVLVTGTTESTDFPLAQPIVAVYPGPLFRSSDDGAHWDPSARGLNAHVRDLVFDPHTPSTMYAATNRGVFKTTDEGKTWTRRSDGLPPDRGSDARAIAIVINPITPATLYVIAEPGVYKTVDAGDHWQRVYTFENLLGTYALAIDAGAPDTVFVGGRIGVYKTTDGGRTWLQADAGLYRNFGPLIYSMIVDPLTRGTLYAGLDTGLYKSTNGGGSWSLLRGDLTWPRMDPGNPRTLYALSNAGSFRSTDAGATWTRFPEAPVGLLAVAPGETVMYGLVDVSRQPPFAPCIVRSADSGKTWQPASADLNNQPFDCGVLTIAFHPLNPAIAFAGTITQPVPYLARLAPDGSLIYSTYLTDGRYSSMAADAGGNAYLAGLAAREARIRVTKISSMITRLPLPTPPPFLIRPSRD